MTYAEDFEIQIGDTVYGVAITHYSVDYGDDGEYVERDWVILDDEGKEVTVSLSARDERRITRMIDEEMA